ncbi:hypothetical protein Scep_008316 [Stephania cephalantha]|uniref:Uncharacterized protein n=1 Tax=Stephania cephalantha TaxID=152367 RepID=A0AAP0PP04_9MAGN
MQIMARWLHHLPKKFLQQTRGLVGILSPESARGVPVHATPERARVRRWGAQARLPRTRIHHQIRPNRFNVGRPVVYKGFN